MTPQQIEVMKLALEFVESINLGSRSASVEKQRKAITALEKALAEHAMQEVQRLGQEIEPDDIASILACRDMLDAQPVPEVDRVIWPEHTEQEPLATVTSETGADITMSWWHEPALPIGTKLYATPPQRKPLTDEEIFACENSVPDEIVSDRDWCIHFARAIEAAHGIKENT